MNNEDFKKFNITLDDKMAKVQGEVLYPPSLNYQNQNRTWDDYERRRIKHSQPITLKRESWTLVYGARAFNDANKVLDMMRQAGSSMGITTEDPEFVEMPDSLVNKGRRGEGYVEAVSDKNAVRNDTMIVLVLLDRPEKKNLVKKCLDERGIPSQFLLLNTISRA